MDAPLAPHLTRFSPPALVVASDETVLLLMPDLESETSVAATAVDLESRIRQAEDALRLELDAKHAAASEQAQARHDDALATAVAAASAQRDAEQGALIAGQIAAAIEAMREALSQDIARALRPLLAAALVTRTVETVSSIVTRAIADRDHPHLTIRGPASLLAAIETGLDASSALEFVATDEDDIIVSANAFRIETRLAQALATIVGEG